jgi:hypothetical protein
MRFVTRLKALALRFVLPRVPPAAHSTTATNWRTERRGQVGGYAVSGWRYNDLAIWHVKVRPIRDRNPGKSYVVSAGEFYPEAVLPVEKYATLHLIAFWEADGFKSGLTPFVVLEPGPGENR